MVSSGLEYGLHTQICKRLRDEILPPVTKFSMLKYGGNGLRTSLNLGESFGMSSMPQAGTSKILSDSLKILKGHTFETLLKLIGASYNKAASGRFAMANQQIFSLTHGINKPP